MKLKRKLFSKFSRKPYIIHISLNKLVLSIYRHDWTEGHFIERALITMEDYFFNIIGKLLISPLHKSKTLKQYFEVFIQLYFEKFIFSVQKRKKVLHGWQPQILDIDLMKRLRKEKNEKESNLTVLINLNLMEKCMLRDVTKIKDEINEKYFSYIHKNFVDKTDQMFTIIFKLFKVPKFDFESCLISVYEIFNNLGIYLLEAVLSIREDCDANFKKNMLSFYANFVTHQEGF